MRRQALKALAAAPVLTAFSAEGQTKMRVQPIIAHDVPSAQRVAMLNATTNFYTFWDTGDETYLNASISPHFVDRTLPPGRPQGPTGPAFASQHFRQAVPDLRCNIRQMILADDRVVTHMNFTGHFTGKFGHVHGRGEAIDFIATDIVRVQDGLITDNWHIEDNLTLLTQMGVATVDA
jgi:predicted ester cyclase